MKDFATITRATVALTCFLAIPYRGHCEEPIAAAKPMAAGGQDATATSDIEFNRDIRPILSDACFACHGPDQHARQAELRLDDRDNALASGAIVAGDPDASGIMDRILSQDPDVVMPPPRTDKALSATQIDLFRRWIAGGAKYQRHWSMDPPRPDITPPSPPQPWSGWPRHPIDRFALGTMLDHGMTPAPEVDALRWLRRARFDLTGLPPTLEEIREIQIDDSEAARERMVDRWLDSPAYGERMASMWLDVARYADTFGYQADVNMDVWPWRDWVIRAFSENLPYDQFITWQIAGDQLPDATLDQRLATTFNRLHRQTNEGGSIEEEFRQVYIADRTVTAGTAFLGLTLECSRCHDHKYDPILQKDFYALAAYFADIDEHGLYSHFTRATPTPALSLYTEGQKETLDGLQDSIAQAEAELQAWILGKRKEWDAAQVVSVSTSSLSPVTPEADAPATPWSFPLEGSEPGVVGNATRFNGDDAVSVSLNKPDADDATKTQQVTLGRPDPFSLSLWVRPTLHADRVIVLHQSVAAEDAAFRGMQLVLEQGKPQFSLIHFWPGDAIRIEAFEEIPVERWTQLGVTYDGSSRADGLQLFVNGERVAAQVLRDQLTRDFRYRSEWGDSNGNGVALGLGARFRDIGFRDGCIDELNVFDRELSCAEMARTMVQSPSVDSSMRAAVLARAESAWDPRGLRGDPEYDALLNRLTELRRKENEWVVGVRQIMTMRSALKPRTMHVLERGAYDAPRAVVSPQPLQQFIAHDSAPADQSTSGMRLELAQWMVDPNHPLVSRVAVNRFWSVFFGRGIVASLEDFGSQGQVPTHPELLDWLSRDFVAHGWDVKRLCKQIVLSATYRQSSTPTLMAWEANDPDNRWLARGPRHRLSAEQLRDAALFATGLLVPTVGGPSVMPYQPPGLWEEAGTGKSYAQAKGEGLYRRSMYTFWRRTAPPPSMLAFDATSRETCTARRETTTTPLQALVLLNDPQYIEAARAIAESVCKSHPVDSTARWEELALRLISRPLAANELAIVEQLHSEQRSYFAEDVEAAKAFLAVGDRAVDPSLDGVELAATTVVAQTLMCFDEFVMKR